jgi:hypothetical protein
MAVLLDNPPNPGTSAHISAIKVNGLESLLDASWAILMHLPVRS